MLKNKINLLNTSGCDTPECTQICDIIESFNVCDLRLKLAIDQNDESEIIRCDKVISVLIEDLLNFEAESIEAKKMHINFLINKFILPENAGQILKKRVTDKILSTIT